MRNKNRFAETKQYLSQIRRMTALIENRRIEKAELETLACDTSVKIKDDMVHTMRKSDRVANYAVEIAAIDEEIQKFKDKKKLIVQQVESLPNVNHVSALSIIYIRGMRLCDIAAERERSEKTAQRDLNAAYEEFEKLYGKTYLKKQK